MQICVNTKCFLVISLYLCANVLICIVHNVFYIIKVYESIYIFYCPYLIIFSFLSNGSSLMKRRQNIEAVLVQAFLQVGDVLFTLTGCYIYEHKGLKKAEN